MDMEDPIYRIAAQVADCLSARGYAFVEDDKLETLAAVLRTFLTVTGTPVNVEGGANATPVS